MYKLCRDLRHFNYFKIPCFIDSSFCLRPHIIITYFLSLESKAEQVALDAAHTLMSAILSPALPISITDDFGFDKSFVLGEVGEDTILSLPHSLLVRSGISFIGVIVVTDLSKNLAVYVELHNRGF